MSHVTAMQTKFGDLDTLEAAAERLGGQLVRGQKSYEWWGRYVGDSTLPEHLRGLSNEQLSACDHVIKFPGAKYEVGVVATAEGFELRFDYWSSGGLLGILGDQNGSKLVQAYALAAAEHELAAQGYQLTEETLADGTVRMTAVLL